MTRTPRPDQVQKGDTVRVGKGKTVWIVEGWTSFYGVPYAVLCATTGYANSTAAVDRLTIIAKGKP